MTRWLIAAVGLLAFIGSAHAAATLADLAQAGQDAAALKMIDAGVDVNAPQSDATTALDWAVYRLDIPLAGALLKHGANPNLANNLGSSPLEEAVEAGNFELVKMLLQAGAKVDNPGPDGQTALMAATHTGVLQTVKLLVRHGASVNAREQMHGQTALMWAVALKDPEVAKYLIDHGANVDTRAYFNDWLDKEGELTSEPRAQNRPEGGLTPLLYAVRSGCLDCVQALLKKGADMNRPTPEGITPLIAAIDNRHYDVAKYLLQHGANLKTWDWYGRTPLYVAVDVHTYNDFGRAGPASGPSATVATKDTQPQTNAVDIIRMLLGAGADPNAQLDLWRPGRGANSGRFEDNLLHTGATPLLRAAMSHDNVVIQLLLAHGASVDLPNDEGVTPLIAAAGMGFRGPHGSLVPDHRGDYAPGAESRAVATLAILLEAGANVNARVTDDDTVSYLTRIGRNDSLQHRQGQTALYGAIYWNWASVVQFLLQHDAKANVVDSFGQTPLMVATHGNEEVGTPGYAPDKAIIAMLAHAVDGQVALLQSSP
ncbi:MAG TPA: ankyrin repeat domain-containing protein [Steroidobacteraceae bacterium]|jgi:ankyrin repeat protein|nr:ankyrin repeat domain-containing protein [Steroidobacteraceae bacterium]